MSMNSEVELDKINELQKYLMNIRHSLTPQGKVESEIQQSLNEIVSNLPTLHDRVHKILHFYNNENYKDDPVFQTNLKQNKLLMYYFQLLNLILINLKQYKHSLNILNIKEIENIFIEFQRIQEKMYEKTFKAFLIFYFNLLKKLSSQLIQGINLTIIFNLLSKILQCYFLSHLEQNKQKQVKFQQQTEWIGLIFQLIPIIKWNVIDNKFSESFIKNYFNLIKNQQNEVLKRKFQYNILHMLGNYLQLLIQSRTTTQIIKGYKCPIQDVNQMYEKPSNDKLCNIKLQLKDVMFICDLLVQQYKKQKAILRQIFTNKQQTCQKALLLPDELIMTVLESEEQIFHDQSKKINSNFCRQITIGDLLLQTINVLNSVLFLGGYNPELQSLISKKLLENDILPEFLELSYLIYTQRRFMGKYSIKISMAKPPDANLSKLLLIDYQSISKEQRKFIYKLVSAQIKFGQLSGLLRLMTNLIHINNSALSYFENNIKYLHMIMSLTHQSQINLTMKNWAVLFIKNCCDNSKLRQQIQSIKIQMKVDE